VAIQRGRSLQRPFELLRALPVLTKDEVREKLPELCASDVSRRRWFYNASGGSTGSPVQVIQDTWFRDAQRAVRMVFDRWAGYRIGEAKVVYWGSERDLRGGSKIATSVYRWLANERWINAFEDNCSSGAEVLSAMQRQRSAHLVGYADSLFQLARSARATDRRDVPKPRAIVSSAGTLDSKMRDEIISAFGAPVFNRYGSREVGDMACECAHHGGLHVAAPAHVVEIMDDEGVPCPPGVMGHIVVTPLSNWAMPLVRYAIGDMGVWEDELCECPIKWPLLSQVYGRSSDILINDSGGRVHGEYFTHLFYGCTWVKQFQVVQESRGWLVVRIVKSEGVSEEMVNRDLAVVERGIRQAMGHTCRMELRFVDSIEATPSGKYRFTISKVGT